MDEDDVELYGAGGVEAGIRDTDMVGGRGGSAGGGAGGRGGGSAAAAAAVDDAAAPVVESYTFAVVDSLANIGAIADSALAASIGPFGEPLEFTQVRKLVGWFELVGLFVG